MKKILILLLICLSAFYISSCTQKSDGDVTGVTANPLEPSDANSSSQGIGEPDQTTDGTNGAAGGISEETAPAVTTQAETAPETVTETENPDAEIIEPEPSYVNPNVVPDEKKTIDGEEQKHYGVMGTTLTGYDGESKDLIIPAGVTDISEDYMSTILPENIYVEEGSTAFMSREGILYDASGEVLVLYPKGRTVEEITIPDYTVRIGYGAFTGMTGLKSVTMNEGLQQITGWSFGYCTALETVNFPSTLYYIGVTSFKDCTALTELVIPDSVTTIDNAAFYCCSALKKVTLGSQVRVIGHNAFSATALEEINIPASVTDFYTYAGESPFDGTPWYEGLTDEYVTAGDEVLIKYNGDKDEVVIPYTVKAIAPFVFGFSNSVKTVYMNRSVTLIEENMWAKSVGIEYVG